MCQQIQAENCLLFHQLPINKSKQKKNLFHQQPCSVLGSCPKRPSKGPRKRVESLGSSVSRRARYLKGSVLRSMHSCTHRQPAWLAAQARTQVWFATPRKPTGLNLLSQSPDFLTRDYLGPLNNFLGRQNIKREHRVEILQISRTHFVSSTFTV